LTGQKTPFVITEDQNNAVYRAVPGISDKLPTYNGKNLHFLILNSLFFVIFQRCRYQSKDRVRLPISA